MRIQEVLVYIGEKLNEEQIIWGIGGSVLLNHYSLAENPRDIDIFIALEHINEADAILKKLGEKQDRLPNSLYKTEHFLEYVILGVDVDIMAGLKINHDLGVYNFTFNAQSVTKKVTINEVEIPLTSLEDWYVIYQLLGDREVKVEQIENYLNSTGLINAGLLEKSLTANLPEKVKERVKKLIASRSLALSKRR